VEPNDSADVDLEDRMRLEALVRSVVEYQTNALFLCFGGSAFPLVEAILDSTIDNLKDVIAFVEGEGAEFHSQAELDLLRQTLVTLEQTVSTFDPLVEQYVDAEDREKCRNAVPPKPAKD
jgi:hypothetical protein